MMSNSIEKSKHNSPQERRNGYEVTPSYYVDSENNAPGSLDPKTLIALLLRYKWFVLLFLMVGAGGAWMYADYITPTYVSSGTILISSSDASTNDELSQIIAQTTGYGTGTTLENELQILQSRKFSRQIAQKIIDADPGDIQDFPILWKREETGEIYKAGVESVASRIRSNISFRRPEEDSEVIEVRFTSTSPVEAARVVNESMEIYVENSTRQNRQAAASTAEFLEKEKREIKQRLEASEERLRRYMDETGIVQVDEQASGIVSQRSNTEAELQNVNLELQTIEEAIANYESRLEKIKPGLSDQFSEAIGPRIQSSQDELARFERERTLIITKNPGVLERQPVPPRLRYVDEQIERLKREIRGLSSQLFTDSNEFMGLNSGDRAQMVADIQSNLVQLRIAQNQNLSRRDVLRQHKREMDANFNALPEGMIELAKLQRDVRINEELYLNVSRQYADMSVWEQSQFGFGRIIDSGEIPSVPVSPNKKILLLLGMMLSGFFSAGFIAVREFMDNSVKSVDNLRTYYLPRFTFSVIPSFEKVSKKQRKLFKVGEGPIPDEMVMLYNRNSMTSESIRRLKNNIIYQHGDMPPKTIAITSPEKGDGKSTVVANLGVAFAEEGYKTLLIDADFRRPKLHTCFGLPVAEGLADYLSAQIPIQQMIKNSDINALKIITAGKSTEKPEQVGGSMTFRQMLKKMGEVFDVIIIDTPPFGIISDSAGLLKGAQNTLVVARYRTTNRGMLLRTIEELGRIQANVIDVVLNDFDHRKEISHYYGSGYYQTLYTNYDSYVR